MADTINLSDVSTKDDSKLKTGGRRKHTMPTPKECNKIKDPAKKKRCLSYAGEYAKKKKKVRNIKWVSE